MGAGRASSEQGSVQISERCAGGSSSRWQGCGDDGGDGIYEAAATSADEAAATGSDEDDTPATTTGAAGRRLVTTHPSVRPRMVCITMMMTCLAAGMVYIKMTMTMTATVTARPGMAVSSCRNRISMVRLTTMFRLMCRTFNRR